MEDTLTPAAILWDMDGTLVDSEPLWGEATYQMAQEMGRPITPEIRQSTIGGTTRNTIEICARNAGLEVTEELVEHWYEWMMQKMEILLQKVAFMPGIPDLLVELHKKGIPMALVTNTARRLTGPTMHALGEESFTSSMCGDEVEHGKPSPDIYLAAAGRLHLDIESCLVVEDSATGMLAGSLAGATVLGVPSYETEQTAGSVPPDVHTLREIRPGSNHLEGIGADEFLDIYSKLAF